MTVKTSDKISENSSPPSKLTLQKCLGFCQTVRARTVWQKTMVFVPRQDSRLAQSYSLGLSIGPGLIKSFGKPPKTRRLPEAMPNQVRGLNFNQAAHVAGRSGVMEERPGARGKQWGISGRRGFAAGGGGAGKPRSNPRSPFFFGSSILRAARSARGRKKGGECDLGEPDSGFAL